MCEWEMVGGGRAGWCEKACRRSLQKQQGQHCGMGKESARVFAVPGQQNSLSSNSFSPCTEKIKIFTVAETTFVVDKKRKTCPFLWTEACRAIKQEKCWTQISGSLVIWSNLQNFNLCLFGLRIACSVPMQCLFVPSSSCCVFICDTVTVHFFTFFLSHLLLFPFSLGVLCTVNLSSS